MFSNLLLSNQRMLLVFAVIKPVVPEPTVIEPAHTYDTCSYRACSHGYEICSHQIGSLVIKPEHTYNVCSYRNRICRICSYQLCSY